MSWFKILKENRLVSQNITHTKVGENEPEQSDDKCRKKLKERFLKLKDRNESMMRSDSWHGDIETDSYSTETSQRDWVGPNKRKAFYNDSQAVDKFVESLDDVSEEMCCRILETIQDMVVKGKDWYKNQITNLSTVEWEAVNFPDYNKALNVKISNDTETTYILLRTNFFYSNKMYFSLNFSRNRDDNDHFNENSDAAYGLRIEYRNTDSDGRDLGQSYEDPKWNVNNESENLEVRVPRNLILFMNFILSMGE